MYLRIFPEVLDEYYDEFYNDLLTLKKKRRRRKRRSAARLDRFIRKNDAQMPTMVQETGKYAIITNKTKCLPFSVLKILIRWSV